jgi:hypothetical protein
VPGPPVIKVSRPRSASAQARVCQSGLAPLARSQSGSVDMYIGYLSMYLWYDDWFISDFSSSPPYDDVKFFNFWLWNRNSENLYKIEIPINKKNNRFYESIRYRNRKIASKIEKVSLYSSAVCAIYKKG